MRKTNYKIPTVAVLPGSNNKAFIVIDHLGNKFLYSYETPIAVFDHHGVMHRLWEGWSVTSGRHFMEFCRGMASSTWYEEGRKPYWDSLRIESLSDPFLLDYLAE